MLHDYPATAGLSGVTMDVSALVSQMNETLSTIHSTIASLKTTGHDSRLDDLERQRDLAISSLHKAFDQEDTVLSQRRQAERDEIAQRRRREDEELERRRRLEDEELAEKQTREDDERRARLEGKARGVEEETDEQMGVVEEEAQRMLDDGRDKLRLLEEKRQVSLPVTARTWLRLPTGIALLTSTPLDRSSIVSLTSSSRLLFRPPRSGGGACALARTRRPLWSQKVSHRRLLWLTNMSVTTLLSRPLKRTATRMAKCQGLRSGWHWRSGSGETKLPGRTKKRDVHSVRTPGTTVQFVVAQRLC